MSRPLTDLERCRVEGISLTELLRRRREAEKRMADPAIMAFRRELRKALGLPAEPATLSPGAEARQP